MIFQIFRPPTVPSGYLHENKASYIWLSGLNWNTNCSVFDSKVERFYLGDVISSSNSELLGKIAGSCPVRARS